MSFNSPLFGFFDAANNQVRSSNGILNHPRIRYCCPRGQLVTIGTPSNIVLQKGGNGPFDKWSNAIIPSTDLLEHEKNYELNIALPGVKDKKDINIEYYKETSQIVVSGEIPSVITEENKDRVRVREIASGKFRRVIKLPRACGIDADNIKATYNDGILRLNVPRLEPTRENEVKKISISSKL